MCNIDEILLLLDWNRSKEEQQEGIQLAGSVQCLKAFFQPTGMTYGKNIWENCAIVICNRHDDELLYYIEDMLLWLQDLNWPGALRIQHRLLQFTKTDMLAAIVTRFIPALEAIGDEIWLENIAKLTGNDGLRSKLDQKIIAHLLQYNRH